MFLAQAAAGAVPQPESTGLPGLGQAIPPSRPLSDTVKAVAPPESVSDSVLVSSLMADSSRRSDTLSRPSARDSAPRDTVPPAPPRFFIPSASWTVGAGAPTFPLRERFRSELALTDARDTTLTIDQPWDGSQLGFSTGLEAGLQHDFVRGTIGAEWSFWDSRAVARNTHDESLQERTWRVDQLLGLAGVDLIIPQRLLSVTGATEPHLGIRAAYGVGRLVGTGRAWAYGGGWQAYLGADAASFGPLVVGGRLGWSSLSMKSNRPMSHVLYDGVGSDDIEWNGSGLWLNLVLRLRPTPPAKDSSKTRTRSPAGTPGS